MSKIDEAMNKAHHEEIFCLNDRCVVMRRKLQAEIHRLTAAKKALTEQIVELEKRPDFTQGGHDVSDLYDDDEQAKAEPEPTQQEISSLVSACDGDIRDEQAKKRLLRKRTVQAEPGKMKWISLTDDLPTVGTQVFVIDEDSGYAHVAWMNKSNDWRYYTYEGCDSFLDQKAEEVAKCPTHWMPIIKPGESAKAEPAELNADKVQLENDACARLNDLTTENEHLKRRACDALGGPVTDFELLLSSERLAQQDKSRLTTENERLRNQTDCETESGGILCIEQADQIERLTQQLAKASEQNYCMSCGTTLDGYVPPEQAELTPDEIKRVEGIVAACDGDVTLAGAIEIIQRNTIRRSRRMIGP